MKVESGAAPGSRVEHDPTDNLEQYMEIRFNPKELLTLAIQIERNGYDYYSRIAAKLSDPKIRAVMESLARAEKQHIADFQEIERRMQPEMFEVPEEYLSPEIEVYLQSMASHKVFTNLQPVEAILASIRSDADALRHALTFEKDSILYFTEIHDLLPDREPNRDAVARLIRQEKIHIARLFSTIQQLTPHP